MIIRDRAGSGTKSNSACGSQRGKDMNHVWEAKKVVYPLSQTERAAGERHSPDKEALCDSTCPAQREPFSWFVCSFVHLLT